MNQPCFYVCSGDKGLTCKSIGAQHYRLRAPNNFLTDSIHPHDILWHTCIYPKPSVFSIPGSRTVYNIFREGERPPANQRSIPQYFLTHSWADRRTRKMVIPGEYTHLYPGRRSRGPGWHRTPMVRAGYGLRAEVQQRLRVEVQQRFIQYT
jgi:hypothetical protein